MTQYDDLHRTFKDDQADKLRSKLLEIKRDTGVSQERMAIAIGVSIYTLHRWFQKGMGNPHTGTILLIEQFIDRYEEAKRRGTGAEFLKRMQHGTVDPGGN
jgi:transcriptional regulator with XRE-family HTH domain